MLSRRAFTRNLSAALAGAVTLRSQTPQARLFQHGVASGDPLADRVILWTRLSPPSPEALLTIEWVISDDPSLRRVLQQGITATSPAYDYTVKVDVARLEPGRTYYYRFSARGVDSPIGRTRTLPLGATNRARFAVASCSNYPQGFFNAYRAIANRSDLDAVLHLGDYIYEYANGGYGDGTELGRIPDPDKELLTLEDYRRRYACYRSDPDLQEAHRQHPWIVVWDDHETANDTWSGGAQNHTPATEGDWAVRRAAANQAWFEWMPVRENPFLHNQIYRTFRFGDLADVIMLDTRQAGRDRQVRANDPALNDPNRALLGADQEAWLEAQLAGSRRRGARWRLLGQQVMMAHYRTPEGLIRNPDIWDGYPASRERLLRFVRDNGIKNLVVLTGDIHSSWANEIALDPFAAASSERLAVEFVTPAISSQAAAGGARAGQVRAQLLESHPYIKYAELTERGYVVVDLTPDRVVAEWYYVSTVRERSAGERRGAAWAAASGESRLQSV